MKSTFKIEKRVKDEMIVSIQQYFLKERGEELGNLAAMLVLDFIMKELAPVFYNQGIEDAQQYMTERLEDVYGLKK